jgi:hypothetical protein
VKVLAFLFIIFSSSIMANQNFNCLQDAMNNLNDLKRIDQSFQYASALNSNYENNSGPVLNNLLTQSKSGKAPDSYTLNSAQVLKNSYYFEVTRTKEMLEDFEKYSTHKDFLNRFNACLTEDVKNKCQSVLNQFSKTITTIESLSDVGTQKINDILSNSDLLFSKIQSDADTNTPVNLLEYDNLILSIRGQFHSITVVNKSIYKDVNELDLFIRQDLIMCLFK